MSLNNNWYTPDEAASKYGVSKEQLLEWAELGLIRTEGHKGKVALVNSDDIEQELRLVPSL